MRLGSKLGCHQIHTRSYFVRGYQLPLCARCTGVLAGEIIAIICLFLVELPILYSFLLSIPMAIDWSIQQFMKIESNNTRRLITGLLAGFALSFIYYYVIKFGISILM